MLFLCLISLATFAEGSKEFLANPLDTVNPCNLNIYNLNSGSGSIMNCPEFKRIYFRINNPATELIDVGFKQGSTNRYYRIFDPNGNLFVAGTAMPTTGSGAGRIPFCKQNIEGPANTLTTGGYIPTVYTPSIAGEYWIEFNRDNNFVTPVLNAFVVNLWDITIVKTSGGLPYTPITGRVHCKTWNIGTGNSNIGMKPPVYAYTTDSTIHKINFNGLGGINWTLSMNSYGITNTGTVATNRMSIAGDAAALDTLGEYPLFYNLPDTNYYKVTQIPLQMSFATNALTGCIYPAQGTTQCINIIANKNEVISLLINLNGIAGYQAGTEDTVITYAVVPGANCIPWNGMNGLGNYVPVGTPIQLTATIQQGITHIPLFDVEENPNGIIVQCLLPLSVAGTPLLFYDDSGLGAGSSFTGCVSPCHPWTNALGNNNTINTWFFGTYISNAVTVVGPAYTPAFNFSITNPDCTNDLSNGVITYSPQFPYVFEPTDSVGIYQFPATSPSVYQVVGSPFNFTNLAPGTYSLSIKSETGCSYDSTITLIPVGLATTSIAGPNQSICLPLDSTLMAANSPTSGTGMWAQVSGPQAIITTPSSPITSITGLVQGTFVFEWAITNGTCPASTSQVTIIVNTSPPPPLASNNTPICAGDTINLTASATAGVTYSWTGPNNFSSSLQNPFITNSTSLEAGIYSVSTSIGTCTTAVSTTLVIINPLPATPVLTNNTPVCEGDTVQLSATTATGAGYNWTGPNGFSSTMQNPQILNSTTANSGVYSITVTDSITGCTSITDSTTVVVNVVPVTPATGNNSPLCQGDTLNLTSTTLLGATYTWIGPNSFSSTSQNPFILNTTLLQAGTYFVFATLGTCVSTIDSTIVLINTLPQTPVAISNSALCAGDTLQLTTSSASGISYNWIGPNSFSSYLQNPILGSSTAQMAGTYSLTVTDSVTGCSSIAGTTAVVINPLPITPLAGSNSPLCVGSTLYLTSSAGNFSYSWIGPNNFSSSVQNPTLPNSTVAMNGAFSVMVTNLNTGCISLWDTTFVVINQLPATPTATSNSPVCIGTSISLTTPFSTSSTYNWTGPNSYFSSLQNPTIQNATSAMGGTYSVTVTDSTTGCTSLSGTTSVIINQLPPTPTATSNSPLCAGDTLLLTTPNSAFIYQWFGPNSFSSSTQNPVLLNADVTMAGTYYLKVTDVTTGCTSLAGTTTVIVNPLPATPVATSSSLVCPGDTLLFTSTTIAGVAYSWTGPNNFLSSAQNPYIVNATNSMSGIYSVTVTNIATGCKSASDTTTVLVDCPLPVEIIIPNVFSPNNDGVNDFFTIGNVRNNQYNLQIFNRWGKLIWENENNFTGWDGKIKGGTPAADGTYYFVLVFDSPLDKYSTHGYIMLIR